MSLIDFVARFVDDMTMVWVESQFSVLLRWFWWLVGGVQGSSEGYIIL